MLWVRVDKLSSLGNLGTSGDTGLGEAQLGVGFWAPLHASSQVRLFCLVDSLSFDSIHLVLKG